MSERVILLLAAIILTASCAGRKQEIPPQVTTQEPAFVTGMSSDKAIGIANEAALKSFPSLKEFKPVACEQQIFWRVIYDGGGPEFLVDKISGKIIWSQTIPQGPNPSRPESKTTSRITRANAVDITKEDLKRSMRNLDLDFYVVHACELDHAWRVIVEPKLTIEPNKQYPAIPNGITLDYVIDKSSGEILFKQRT
jgi:hypothetical protein